MNLSGWGEKKTYHNRDRHNCEGEFIFTLDSGKENLLFAECVDCGYLNYMDSVELVSLGAKGK